MDILKNPIIIALCMGAITYVYLQKTTNEENKKRVKKGKKKLSVNLMIPLAVACVSWFISYAYFDYANNKDSPSDNHVNSLVKTTRPPLPLPVSHVQGYKFVGDLTSQSSDAKSFSLLNNGVTIPTKIPDVLMEMY